MIGRGQGQRAGAGASQVQVAGDLVLIQGVNEERAFEIAREAAKGVIAEYSEESYAVAEERIGKFDVAMIRNLSQADLLGALGDPAVQVTMRKAQIGAASTEREGDYEILAGLIEDRVKRSGDRPVRASINRAVEVVDQIDGLALAGLTLMQAAQQISPMAGAIGAGLDDMERLLEQLMDDVALPEGIEWVEHLDVLGAVRLDGIQTFRTFDEYWPTKTPGYVSAGVPYDSEEIPPALRRLMDRQVIMQPDEHELKPNYLRLRFPSVEALDQALVAAGKSEEDRLTVIDVARNTFMLDTADPNLFAAYMEKARARPCHLRLAEWWGGLSQHFAITTVGRVLARANAKRLDQLGLLPPLE